MTRALTTTQVADRLQCSTEHVRQLIQSQELRAFDIGRVGRKEWRIEQVWLDEFIRSKQNSVPDHVANDPVFKECELILNLD